MNRSRGLVCVCFGLVVWALAATPLSAASRALIFVGLSANDTQAARLRETATLIQTSLVRRGLAPDSVAIHAPAPDRPLRRDHILTALSATSAATASASASGNETWVILLGTSAPDRSGQPAFQVAGPRLTAADLSAAIAALPGKKTLVLATSASGGFLPSLLAIPDVEAVAATAESGQVSEPRFASFWAEELAADPAASFQVLAARAADRVTAYYSEQSLAQSETARLIDRAGSRILEAPFSALAAASDNTPKPSPSSPSSAALVDISALNIPKATGKTEIERRPADDESRALLAAAREAARGSPYAALILRRELEAVVGRDFSRRETWRLRAYLRTGEALDDFGTLQLGNGDPFASVRLITARVVRPDASQLLLNPAARSARLATEVEAERDRELHPGTPPPSASSSTIHLPELSADCVLETEWSLDLRASGELPELYQEWHFASPYPQKSLRIVISLPNGSPWRVFTPDLSALAAVNSTYSWNLAEVPAFEPLPGDLPARAVAPWIGVSSVATWDDFAAWYRRLAAGSETAGPEVEALAAEISAAHPDRAARLRAAYERVAALRYVAIELGVGAFRPRTPEQVWRQRFGDCKDKANLLVALLAKLGIPAEFALVNRFDTTFTNFPGWQFNHALARVPAAPEAGQPRDLWLDTTDRLVPFGVVAPGDLGRQALAFSAGFASAKFHEIAAAQEPPAEWRETFTRPAPSAPWRIEIFATGSAENRLRHLLLGLSPARRLARLSDLLGLPVSSVEASDAYDLAAPYRIVFHAAELPSESRPLIPGLRDFLSESPRPRLWDEGRPWNYTRNAPVGSETSIIPARLP